MMYKKIILEGDQRVYFSSDFHLGHSNICRGTTRWDLTQHGGHDSVRDFDTLDQMNDAIINGINSTVGQNDFLVFDGDFSFGGKDNVPLFRKRIICQNLIMVLGNHDKWIPHFDHLFGFNVFSYLELTVSEGKYGKRTYVLFHFPITIWNKAHHNRIHLYGHCHSKYVAPNRSMDVGIDNAFKLLGEYRPFSEKEIWNYMEDREYIQLSHHNKNTN